MVIVPCGGGGLSAGIALALPGSRDRRRRARGLGRHGPLARRAGEIVPVEEPAPPTRCDALQTKRVSPLTFGALRGGRRPRRRGQRGGGRRRHAVRLPAPADRRRARRRGRARRAAVGEGGRARRTASWSSPAAMSIRRFTRRYWAAEPPLRRGRPGGRPDAPCSCAARRHRLRRPTPGRASAALSSTVSSSRDRFGRIAWSIPASAASNWR